MTGDDPGTPSILWLVYVPLCKVEISIADLSVEQNFISTKTDSLLLNVLFIPSAWFQLLTVGGVRIDIGSESSTIVSNHWNCLKKY